MKRSILQGVSALFLVLTVWGAGQAEEKGTYARTVQAIRETMAGATSEARKERYGKIEFDGCRLSYDVYGTYPVGDPYHARLSGIDFTSLDQAQARVGHDYTAFISLSFEHPLRYRTEEYDLEVHTMVINVSDDTRAVSLYRDLLQLGTLCRDAGKVN